MSKSIQEALDSCLFFTVKKLDHLLNKIGEEAFKNVGLTPTYGFILLILGEEDGRFQKDIAQMLHVAPSTLTRFVEKLVNKGYVTTLVEGRTSQVFLTQEGRDALPAIQTAWTKLHDDYEIFLGDPYADELAAEINEAAMIIKDNCE